MELQCDFSEIFDSPPKCSYPTFSVEETSSIDSDLQLSTKIKAHIIMNLETSLFESILRDNRAGFLADAKKLLTGEDLTADRSVSSKLLSLCCAHDSVQCAKALVNGEVGVVPLVNEVESAEGLSPLHAAAEAHSQRCVELLLKRRARTDVRSKDGRALLPLDLSLCSSRMDVIWNPDDNTIEDLVIMLGEKDLTTVKLLSESTKEVEEVAYANSIEGGIVPLAALLIAAAQKVNEGTLDLYDAELGWKQTTTVYECVIDEALSLGTSSAVAKEKCTSVESDFMKRKLLLCEIELLQLFGATAQANCTDNKLTSPLIRAVKARDESVIELLLKTINVNDVDTEGNTALHCSLKMSWPSRAQQNKIVSLLLEHGARVSQRNKLGFTALHFAAANGNLEALEVFLQENPECANSKTEMKETPLFFAVKQDNIDCAELLLRYGATTEVRNLRKQRPIDLAESQDMRFILNPTNISHLNQPSNQRHVPLLCGEIIYKKIDALLKMSDEEITSARSWPGTKLDICKYYESHAGCLRGSKCFYAHGEAELQQMKKAEKLARVQPTEKELKHKIFVGGLPPTLDSDSLAKFFEEAFGPVKVAMVMGIQIKDQIKSRGFGFVTFKHEETAWKAVQARYLNIVGKNVEIKSAISKYLLLKETPKLPFQREKGDKAEKFQAQTPNERITQPKSEKISWVDKLVHGKPKKPSPAESQAQHSENVNMPLWLKKFMEWFPQFLQEVSNRHKDVEYPLSSLKGDFRAIFGMELDHASLGYQKLSDFVKCFPDLCLMKVVPIGRHYGPATHWVLLPCPSNPSQKPLEAIAVSHFSSQVTPIHSNARDSPSLFVSSKEAHEENSAQNSSKENSCQEEDVLHILCSPLLGLLHSLSMSYQISNRDQRKHLVLETLAEKRNSKSVFFLREYDFHLNYRACINEGRCFWCEREKLVWANYPCLHQLWCSECKVEAVKAAGNFEHKCVVCDTKVERFEPINMVLHNTGSTVFGEMSLQA